MSRPAAERARLIAHSRRAMARGSKSFAAASRLLDRRTREHVWLLYGWCRACDDMTDGQDHGGAMERPEDAQTRVAQIHMLTDAALNGEITGEDAFDGLAIVARECAIPTYYIADVVSGFALDADEWRPRSEADMLLYCYHVAGAVGRMMAIVMGIAPDREDVLDRATDLGIAFQLANIARDVEEDDAAGRCYLPVEWLVEGDLPPGQHMKPPFRAQLTELVGLLCDMSERYEASARVGAAALPWRSRWAVLAAAGIYGDIARQVRGAGHHAWDHRQVVGRGSKLLRLGGALVETLRTPPAANREGLWTRPRMDRPL